MSCGCRKNNNCGCRKNNGCGCGKNNGCGCGNNNMQTMDDFSDIFQCGERDLGPYTWNGYVWYDMEVTYTGPYFAAERRPEPRGCGCQRSESRGCGCNC